MTTIKLQEVARAICAAQGYDPDGPLRDYGEPAWLGFEKHARAAIEAMRSPTEAMRTAAGFSPGNSSCHFCGAPDEPWQLMIDSVLGAAGG